MQLVHLDAFALITLATFMILICVGGGFYTLYRISVIEANQHRIMDALGILDPEEEEVEGGAYRKLV